MVYSYYVLYNRTLFVLLLHEAYYNIMLYIIMVLYKVGTVIAVLYYYYYMYFNVLILIVCMFV